MKARMLLWLITRPRAGYIKIHVAVLLFRLLIEKHHVHVAVASVYNGCLLLDISPHLSAFKSYCHHHLDQPPSPSPSHNLLHQWLVLSKLLANLLVARRPVNN